MDNDDFKQLSPLVEGRLPEFIRVDHPTLVAFLAAYYEWLQKKDRGGQIVSPMMLQDVIDIDLSMDEFITQFKKEYILDFPEQLAISKSTGKPVDVRKLMKNIKSFYRAKGTEKSYEFLFRILYDTAVEFYYPKKDILRVSDGKWYAKNSIKLSNTLGDQIFNAVGRIIYQKDTNGKITSSAKVVDVSLYQQGQYDIAELTISGRNGSFTPGSKGITYEDDTHTLHESRIYSVVNSVLVVVGGSGYSIGDKVSFTASAGDSGEGAYGTVSLVSSSGEIRRIRIENSGINYDVAPTVTVQSISGSGFSGTSVVSPICEAEGYYLNFDGRISTNKVLQDNHYYQDFSYVLKTEVVVDNYRDSIRRLVHPAGTAMFGQVLIKRCSRENLMNSSALIRYEVPIIGHYVPYTFVSYDNLQDWFMVGMTGASADSGILISAGYNPSLHDPLIKGDPSGWDLPDASYASRIFLLGSDYNWVGNPISSGVDFVGASGPSYPPLGQTGFQNADPFWIVYEHPNRKIKGQHIARIWKNQMDEVVGIPAETNPDYYYGAGWDEFVSLTGSSLGVRNPGVNEETAYQWKSDFENDPTLEHKYGFLKYSDSSEFRKITARSFFEMPIGEEFDCRIESADTYALPILTITKPLQGHIIRSLRPDQAKTLTVHWVVQNYENLVKHGAVNFRVSSTSLNRGGGAIQYVVNLNQRTVSWTYNSDIRNLFSDGTKTITVEAIDSKGMSVGSVSDTVSFDYIGNSNATVTLEEMPMPNNDLSVFGGLSDPLQYRPNLTSNINAETGGLNEQDNSTYGGDSDGFTNYFISPRSAVDPNGGATGATNASAPSDYLILMDRYESYDYTSGVFKKWLPYFATGSLTADAYYDSKFQELGVKDWHVVYEGSGMWQTPQKPVIKYYYEVDGVTAQSTITINKDNLVDYISTNMGIQPGSTEERYVSLDFETDFDATVARGYSYNGQYGEFRSKDVSQSKIAYALPFWEKKQTVGGIDYLELKGVTGPRDIKVSPWQMGGLVTNSGHLVMFYDKGTTFNTQEWATAEIPNRSDFSSLSIGYDHCIALTTSGTMVGWGLKNSSVGLLGTKAAMDQITAAGKTITKIDAGANHGLALLNDGQVVAWGSNGAAELSDPDRYWTTAGYAAQNLDTYKYYQDRATRWVSDVRQYRCGSFADGNRYSGCESPNGSELPEHRLYRSDGTSVTAGSYLAAGLTQGWEFDTGAPYDYQFSRATTNSLTGPNGLTHINYGGGGWTAAAGATSIFGKSNKTYTDISAGRSHCLILASDGRIETWGDNYYYTVSGSGLHNKDRRTGASAFRRSGSGDGVDIPTGENTAPTVKSLKTGQTGVAAIGTSYYTNMVVRSDGSLFAWDRNEWGESLPSGGLPSMTAGGATGFVSVDGGYHHCCAVRSNGTVACWGAGDLNKTNDGTRFNYGQSIVPDGLGTFKKVVCGQDYTIGVLSNDKVIAWGHIENLLRNHVFVAPTLFPNNDYHRLENFNFVVDTGLTYGNGPNNTRSSKEITDAIKYCRSIFPNVKFSEWGYPSAYNYSDGAIWGRHDTVDWPHATEANKELRIQSAVDMFKPVLTECDFVSFYAYDSYPSQKSIDDGLVPEPDGPYAAKNSWYSTDTNQFLSDENDSQFIAGAEIARRIRNAIGKPNQLLTATISMYSPPGTAFKAPDQQPLLPLEEILDFVKKMRIEQPSMNGITFWTSSDYRFGLALRSQTLPSPLDSDWAETVQYWYTHVPADWRGTAEEYRDAKIAEYTSYAGFQRAMRKSIIALYWDKVDVIANGTYSGWGDPKMRYDTMVKVNEAWLAMFREIRKITA
jgi:alpha-tubulin suppressor-like RCC1 family protein